VCGPVLFPAEIAQAIPKLAQRMDMDASSMPRTPADLVCARGSEGAEVRDPVVRRRDAERPARHAARVCGQAIGIPRSVLPLTKESNSTPQS